MNLEWMAWTGPTAIFFIVIGCLLVTMTCWEILIPSIDRQGFLPIVTSRGDRLFIGLLGSAYLHLAWIGLTDFSIWIVFGISIVWIVLIMRWG